MKILEKNILNSRILLGFVKKSSLINWILSLQKSILKLIIAGCTGSKNQVEIG
jgi:hypothetical protein